MEIDKLTPHHLLFRVACPKRREYSRLITGNSAASTLQVLLRQQEAQAKLFVERATVDQQRQPVRR